MEINHSSQLFITRSHFMDTDYFARRLITLSVILRFFTEINHSYRRSIVLQVFTEIDDYTRTPITIKSHGYQSLLTDINHSSLRTFNFHGNQSLFTKIIQVDAERLQHRLDKLSPGSQGQIQSKTLGGAKFSLLRLNCLTVL